MSIELLEITDQHKRLLLRLKDLVPGLDVEDPAALQKVFGLGLITLTMKVISKHQKKTDLTEELGALARQIVQAEADLC